MLMAEDMAADPIADISIPLDAAFFSTDFRDNDFMLFGGDNENDDVLDFDFTFDDINLPSDTEDFLNSTIPDPVPSYIPSDPHDSASNDNNTKPPDFPDGDPNFNVAGYFNLTSSSSDSLAKSPDLSFNGYSRVLNCGAGPTLSQGSDNNENTWASSSGSVGVVVDQKVKTEDSDKKKKKKNNYDNLLLSKRKKENNDVLSESTRSIKFRRSNNNNNNVGDGDAKSGGSAEDQSNVFNEVMNDDDEKRKARLMRNRESAQLSRQRKKHYVEELEDKVRAMHSAIQDLNARISYVVAENATLRQQMSGGGGGSVVGPPPIPGIYHPPPPLGYPWMPMPPYVVKPQGSQVPLVPIPRLKPHQQPPVTKSNKRGEGKSKTKKVASVSFLGLLFFMLLFGGLVPMVNVKYGGVHSAYTSYYNIRNRLEEGRHGRVLMVNGTNHDSGTRAWKNYNSSVDCGGGRDGGSEGNVKRRGSEEFGACSGNGSEPLVASLFVPRNDKLVKIDGNLIIHSVLASEKAKAEREDAETNTSRETRLAVAFNLAPSVSVPGVGQSSGRHSQLYRTTAEQQRALAAGSASKANLKTTPADGKLQQWFREGLAGPMLSSGMCTKVFQFDVSPAPGAIIPATSVRNVSGEESKNSTHLNKGRSRRILNGLPISLSGSDNTMSKESTVNSSHEETQRNTSLSPMIVSVLVDPREVGDGDIDGMMGTKSLSRIFVVVLLDSVKYVTYSCMLPFMGSTHLVTA